MSYSDDSHLVSTNIHSVLLLRQAADQSIQSTYPSALHDVERSSQILDGDSCTWRIQNRQFPDLTAYGSPSLQNGHVEASRRYSRARIGALLHIYLGSTIVPCLIELTSGLEGPLCFHVGRSPRFMSSPMPAPGNSSNNTKRWSQLIRINLPHSLQIDRGEIVASRSMPNAIPTIQI